MTFEIECETAFMSPVGDVSCTSSYAYESIKGHGLIEAVQESDKEKYLTRLMVQFGFENIQFHPVHYPILKCIEFLYMILQQKEEKTQDNCSDLFKDE